MVVGVRSRSLEKAVQPDFRVGNPRLRHVEAEPPETPGERGDQQGGGGVAASPKIGQAGLDQLGARQVTTRLHGLMLPEAYGCGSQCSQAPRRRPVLQKTVEQEFLREGAASAP